MQSWMEDAELMDAQGGEGQASGPQSCGASANRSSNCGGPQTSGRQEADNPLAALHQMFSQYMRPGQQQQPQRGCQGQPSDGNQVQNGAKKYTIKLDVQHFEPNEISVKIVDNDIVVSGEHPERTDRLGRISRKFQRKYELPADVEPDSIVSTLTPSGVLIIEGLKKSGPNNEIVIPVLREETNGWTDVSAEGQSVYKNDQQMD
jgi:HSP20 family molecular chaperone IbpA